jgi:hypothetical protein
MDKIKKIIVSIIGFFRNLFKKNEKVTEPVIEPTVNVEKNETINQETEPVIIEVESINNPIDQDKLKHGEIGGYLMYDKTKTEFTSEVVQHIKDLGVNILYINTPRYKANPITFEEWLSIFDLFKDSGIKLLIYIYEAVSMTPKWTNEQIKTISNHEAFYGWIGEDEVSYKSYTYGNTWIKKFYSYKWSDGTRKWPNIAVCYYPKIETLSTDLVGENYSDYLNLWANDIDIAHADMYPFISDRTNDTHYNIDDDGKAIHSNAEGEEKWFEYLKEHCDFNKRYPNITHRLYLNTCKHVAKSNDKLYIARPKPTDLTVKIQAYANLLSGSNGLMMFVLNDITSNNSGFSEAPFNGTLEINTSPYAIIKNVFTSNEFINYKNIIVNLKVDDVLFGENIKTTNFISNNENELLTSIAHNNEYAYCTVLNTSLEKDIEITFNNNDIFIVDLKKLTERKIDSNEKYILKPGNIIFLKRNI